MLRDPCGSTGLLLVVYGKKGQRTESLLKLGLPSFGTHVMKQGKIIFGGDHAQICFRTKLERK